MTSHLYQCFSLVLYPVMGQFSIFSIIPVETAQVNQAGVFLGEKSLLIGNIMFV